MDIQAYINSGILEAYFLGMLQEADSREVVQMCLQYPELSQELAAVEEAFGTYALANAMEPPVHMKMKIWETLENQEKEKKMDINDLPLIDAYTNYKSWLELVQPFIPAQMPEERMMHILRHTPQVIQMFVISATDFEDEIHDDLMESFIILDGECECTVGDDVFRLGPGGYAAIPLHLPHKVRMLTPWVSAIMQRVAV